MRADGWQGENNQNKWTKIEQEIGELIMIKSSDNPALIDGNKLKIEEEGNMA